MKLKLHVFSVEMIVASTIRLWHVTRRKISGGPAELIQPHERSVKYRF
jgi:hypothetical protein